MKQTLIRLFRSLGILGAADRFRFFMNGASNLKSNLLFRLRHRDVKLPPAYILYESQGRLNYDSYYFRGKETAWYLADLIKKHASVSDPKILEWGCGPARILRHFPDIFANTRAGFYGSDYNEKTISWCNKALDRIEFHTNGLHPPLNFGDDFFDAVFCISVLTHLSESVQKEWVAECLRVIKPGGIFLLSVHGGSCSEKLLPDESMIYKSSGFVARSGVKEGSRVFTAYNSPEYMRNVLLTGVTLAEFIPGGKSAQDIWIVKK